MPQGKRGKFTIPGHETPRNRHMAKNSKKKKKKNLRFNVGFQPYADHDIYRAIIFFNYTTFVENIFNSYQGGPYIPQRSILPQIPLHRGGGANLKKILILRPNIGV